MNCQLCQKESDAYREGKLPYDTKIQVEAHLKTCQSCSEIYKEHVLAERVINKEKELESDPFLATRIMAQLERLEEQKFKSAPALARVLRPVLVSVSLAAAVAFGIMTGNLLYSGNGREKIPSELALINDSVIESVDILVNE